MHAQIESLIELYLTRDGNVFICPQYPISHSKEHKDGGSNPDFVALDLKNREIIVVEVSVAYDLKKLIARVHERKTRWFKPLRRHFSSIERADQLIGLGDESKWKTRFLGFVRQTRVDRARKDFANDSDVKFVDLESCILEYDYSGHRIEKGL